MRHASRLQGLGEEGDLVVAPHGDAGGATTLIGEKDFGGEEESEHDEYTFADDLGVLRVGKSGTLAVRELSGAKLGPWKKLKTHVEHEDDVVAVDADAHTTVIVFTREALPACPDGAARTAVHVVRLDRATLGRTGRARSRPARAAASPGRSSPAPSRAASPSRGPSAARSTARGPLPVDALAYVVFSAPVRAAAPQVTVTLTRLPVHADLLVDASCDGQKCYAVAISRVAGSEEIAPDQARVLSYP